MLEKCQFCVCKIWPHPMPDSMPYWLALFTFSIWIIYIYNIYDAYIILYIEFILNYIMFCFTHINILVDYIFIHYTVIMYVLNIISYHLICFIYQYFIILDLIILYVLIYCLCSFSIGFYVQWFHSVVSAHLHAQATEHPGLAEALRAESVCHQATFCL